MDYGGFMKICRELVKQKYKNAKTLLKDLGVYEIAGKSVINLDGVNNEQVMRNIGYWEGRMSVLKEILDESEGGVIFE